MSTNVPDSNPAKPTELPTVPSTIAPGEVSKPVPPTATTEGLPEYEPLTPELVEEEAIRGDFVLKWAVILLAVLLGSTVISESVTLVHVKTGQYLASHGLLPPANDVFSASASDHRWINLSWLFDLLAAATYGLGKFMGLSALKAVLVGLAFGFVAHTSKPGESTWWGSICIALAVLACQPRFTAQPDVMTLLGIALCLWMLHKAIWSSNPKLFWMLIPVCAIWSNLDSRAWWGPYILTLFGLGELLGSFVGRSIVADAVQRKTLWLAVVGSWIGLLINPFLWQSWLAPFSQFGTLYPVLSQIYSGRSFLYLESFSLLSVQGFKPDTWIALNRDPVVFATGYFLVLVTTVTLILNHRRVSFGHVLMFFGAIVPVLFAVHSFAAMAVVMCILATINGQVWYSAKFPRVYSIEIGPLLFSRGGRAVTVLGLFTLALLFTFGRLQAGNTRTPGWGLDSDLDGVIRSFETVMQDMPDEGSFNFTPEQGDILIWLGRKPYMDHRIELYATPNDQNLIIKHIELRGALAPRNEKGELLRPTDEHVKLWKDEFNRTKISHVLPRLTSYPPPDSRTFTHLSLQPYWQMTRLSAATAVFCRNDEQSPEMKLFIEKNRFDFGDVAFKTEAEPLPMRDTWPQLPTFYQRYVWKQDRRVPAETREARHRLDLARNFGDRGVGMVYQAIRRAQESLSRNVNDTNSYQLLGEAYMALAGIESPGNLNSPIGNMRYLQSVQAFNLALVADPDNFMARISLVQLYRAQQRADLELRELQAIVDLINQQPTNTVDDERKQIQDLELFGQQIDAVRKRIDQIEQQADKIPQEARAEPTQMAGFYAQSGMFLKALELLKPDDTEVSQPPQEMMFRAQLMLEAGQTEEADEITAALEGLAQQMEFNGWQQIRIAALLASAKYSEAAQILISEAEKLERQSQIMFLDGFVPRPSEGPQSPTPLNAFSRFMYYLESAPQSTAVLNAQAGFIYLEAGQIKQAVACVNRSLKLAPHQQMRPLLAYYGFKMTGQWIDPIDPNDRVPSDVFPRAQ